MVQEKTEEIPQHIKRQLIVKAIKKWKHIHPVHNKTLEYQVAYDKVHFWFMAEGSFHGVYIDLVDGEFPN